MNNIQKISPTKHIWTVSLPDITCTSCASVIERHFTKQKNIEVSINFATRNAYFTYHPFNWTPKKIQTAMKSIGYNIDSSEAMAPDDFQHFHNTLEHEQHVIAYHKKKSHFKKRQLIELIVGILLLIPLLVNHLPGVHELDILRNPYLQLGLTIPIQFYIGRKFYFSTWKELIKQHWPGMHTLVFLSSTIAFSFSIYLMTINDIDHLFFEAGAAIIVIVLLGDFISDVMQDKATSGLNSIMGLQVKEALRENPLTHQQEIIGLEAINVNDILLVRKGQSLPTDGLLLSELAEIDESMISGESNIIIKNFNDPVIGGTINNGNLIKIKALKIGKDTVLSQIIDAMERTYSQKPKLQVIANKIAGWFTPLVIIIGLLVFLLRFLVFNNSLDQSISTAIATLIIACPCALGIATPLAVAVGINKAAKEGLIYQQANTFEKINKITTVCFDKTGTLTTGNLSLSKIAGDQKYLGAAIALEMMSTHPLAIAFQKYFQDNPTIVLPKVINVKEDSGNGLMGLINGQEYIITSWSNLIEAGYIAQDEVQPSLFAESLEINKILALGIDNNIVMTFLLTDELRINALKTVKKLQSKGLQVMIISGDEETKVRTLAEKLGVTSYYSQIKPINKAQVIKDLQNQGEKVIFVGDGINDAVALVQADLSIVMSSGSDIALKNGDITIINEDIFSVYKSIIITHKTKQNIWINFAWAFGYNLVIIPLAALGFIIPPLAVLAMAFSDITVVGNSLFFKIRKFRF